MNRLMQPLKLQLKSCIIPFLANIVLSLISIIVLKLINKNITNIYPLVMIYQTLFAFFFGLFNYNTLGHTYSSLKHDRHNFSISSLIMNIFNTLIIAVLYVLASILLNLNVSAISIISFSSIILLSFSLGNSYSLFLAKSRILNIIAFVVVIVIILPFGAYLSSHFFSLTESFIVCIINIVLTVGLFFVNLLKYKND